MQPILATTNLGVSFEGDPVLKGISFTLNEGMSLAIIGPNGAGKSVLLRALLHMIPYTGTIAWAEKARIGYVPQKIDADRHLPINFTNLLGAKAGILRLPQRDIDEVVSTVGLDRGAITTPVGHLSGGQFQRALIAFALLGKPNVLILDEPTASIDTSGEGQVYELIHRLQDQYGITVILVSHDLSFVYRYATNVLCLDKSDIFFGTADEALTPEALQKLYGGTVKYHSHSDMGHATSNKESKQLR